MPPKKQKYSGGNGSTVRELKHLKGMPAEQTIKDLESGALKVQKPKSKTQTVAKGKENTSTNMIEDLYVPVQQNDLKKIKIMRGEKGFAEPEFYQPPSWKWIREPSRNENSKAKKV
jgi:hypothetical protein